MQESNVMNSVFCLLIKDFTIELRERVALSTLLLFVLVIVLTIYISFLELEAEIWVTMFWIIMLFAALNASVSSLSKEATSKHLFYYTIAHPREIYVSKFLYNLIMLSILGVVCFGLMSMMGGSPVVNYAQFWLSFILGLLGLCLSLTLTSQISLIGGKSVTVSAILGFPVILSVLLSALEIAIKSLDEAIKLLLSDFQLLAGIDLLIFALALLLFPYLWRK